MAKKEIFLVIKLALSIAGGWIGKLVVKNISSSATTAKLLVELINFSGNFIDLIYFKYITPFFYLFISIISILSPSILFKPWFIIYI